MMLLAPWALWFSILGGAVVALYLLKIRRQRQLVPSLEFWQNLASQTQVRSLFQRLKRWLSMLLWLLIVACLILGLANPVLTLGRIKPQAIAVIIDNSASMQTVEPESEGKTRLVLAREALRELTGRRPVSDEWLLIEAARQPRVLQPWTYDPAAVREAANAVQPFGSRVDLAPACKLARQLLEGKERPCLVILSDGAAGQVARLAAEDESIVHWPVGRTNDNLGITRLSVRAHRQQSAHYAYLRVVNASKDDVQTQVVFELDGVTHSVEPLTVPAGGVWEKTVVFNAPGGGVLRAWIDRKDALPADNEAYAILEPIRPAGVLLVSTPKDAFFFEQALVAMESLVDPDAGRTMTIEEYDARSAPPTPPPDLTIFNNCVPARPPAAGAFVCVNAWPAAVPAVARGEIAPAELTLARRDHPLTQYLTLAAVTLTRAKEVDLTQRATVLATSATGTPLIFLVQDPDRQWLCLAFDVLDSDLPFRNAFPIFLRNAVSFMVSEQSAWVADQHAVGEPIEPLRRLPADVSEVRVARLRREGLAEQTIPVRNGSFLFDQTQECGALRFTVGDDTAFTAVNLTDEQESRIAPETPAQAAAERLALTGRLFGAMPWLFLAGAATLLIGFEWLSYHFRWTE